MGRVIFTPQKHTVAKHSCSTTSRNCSKTLMNWLNLDGPPFCGGGDVGEGVIVHDKYDIFPCY